MDQVGPFCPSVCPCPCVPEDAHCQHRQPCYLKAETSSSPDVLDSAPIDKPLDISIPVKTGINEMEITTAIASSPVPVPRRMRTGSYSVIDGIGSSEDTVTVPKGLKYQTLVHK